MNKTERNAADELAWLLWLDVLERLDTILLELRHQQLNIIHELRTPILAKPLQFEENYLWGTYRPPDSREIRSWEAIFERETTPERFRNLVSSWIIPYPRLEDINRNDPAPESPYVDSNLRSSCIQELSNGLQQRFISGKWSQDARRLYYSLCALQTLKCNVLRDKLILCSFAFRALELDTPEKNIGRFLLVRAAVLARANAHVRHLGGLQSQFQTSFDLAIQDHPRPIIGRRKEQGIYSAILSDRCRVLSEKIEEFLANAENSEETRCRRGKYVYLHRWTHSGTSSAEVVKDDLFSDPMHPTARPVDIVTTSFWMPDRPDLQSTIAHEVAHNHIYWRFGDLSPERLREIPGPFGRLARLISACLEAYNITEQAPGRYNLRNAHKELICDLLAATVVGPSYLFSLVQELLGQDIDLLFASPLEDIDFDLAADWLFKGWAGLRVPGFEWFYRIHAVAAWLQACGEGRPGVAQDALSERLITGVTTLSNVLLDTVFDLGPMEAGSVAAHWRKMTEELCRLIKSSQAPVIANQWRTAEREEREASGQGRFTFKYLRPHLQRLIHQRKIGKHGDDLHFKDFYGIDEGDLYQSLEDIPWQSALLRARDFLSPSRGSMRMAERRDWLVDMHHDCAPGRELYEAALEFRYWEDTTFLDPVAMVLKLMKDVDTSTMPEFCREWTKLSDADTPFNQIRKLMLRKVSEGDLLEFHPTTLLQAISSTYQDRDNPHAPENLRKCRKVLQRKLQTLCKNLSELNPLPPEIAHTKVFLDATLATIGVGEQLIARFICADKKQLYRQVKLDRIVVSGPLMGPTSFDQDFQQTVTVLAHSGTTQRQQTRNYTSVLGRYDFFGMSEVDPIARCYLPEQDVFARISYFTRHEMALPFRHGVNDVSVPSGDPQILAVLAVSLATRGMRLPFLHRLADAVAKPPSSPPSNDHPLFSDIGALLEADDLVLLSEGRGDVVVVFRGAPSRLKSIFQTQSAFYADYMVEGTELMLAWRCLQQVGIGNEFAVVTRVRLSSENKPLWVNQNTKFLQIFNDLAEKCLKARGTTDTRPPFSVSHTPGRTDFSIKFHCLRPFTEGGAEKLLGRLENVDEILTTLGRKMTSGHKENICIDCRATTCVLLQ